MVRMDRRRFLGASAAAAGSIVGTAAASEHGDVAASRPQSVSSDGRDPLGLAPGADNLTAETVRRAIEDGVRYLKSQQLADGTWPDQPHYDNGLTPLATLALLHAGCDAEDTHVAKALAWLREYVPRSTYTASIQTMVFCLADPKKFLPLVMRNAKWLESRQWQKDEQVGMWAMSPHGSVDHTDNSMTHFAMLALFEAERVGFRVRPVVWQLALDHWHKTQNDDGSWGWGPKYPGSGSITCAGIAAITIATSQLEGADATVRGDDVVGCGLQQNDPSLERAFAWLTAGFSVYRNPGTEFWHSYYLYALERAGRMTGRRFIGTHDWYREGARALVATQEFSGAWPADVEFQKVADRNVATSFSLMFLSKGRWPVVLAHLQHRPDDDWNRHRASLGNLVAHVEQAWGRNLTHQNVDISAATVEDLLEAPVLLLNGRNAPEFSAEDIKKLRMYVDRGGFLFAERCCGGTGFDTGFRALVRDIFPESEFELQLLPPDHPVWFADGPIDAKHMPPLWGVDVSCRTGLIFCPTDLSAYWELDRLGREREYSDAIQEKLRAARQVGVNVLTYATGRDVEFKNPALPLTAEALDPNAPFERGKLYVANVLHPGGCHAAPAALANLLRRASEDFRVEVSRVPREVELTNPDLFKYHLITMHGRSSFELTPAERERLREYLERGGTLVADAICSSPAFAKSFRREMQEVFPTASLSRIPPNDSIFTPAFGGTDIRPVSRRRQKSLLTVARAAPATTQESPRLEAIRLGDRYVVIFSPDDISCALETEPMGCAGYVRRDAIQIALNIVLYAVNQ
jgi:hypothetical protein